MSAQGTLGSKDLAAGVHELICTLDEPGIVNITVCSRVVDAAKISIAIGYSGTDPQLKDFIQYDMPLDGNYPLERNGRSLGTGARVWIRSDINGCTGSVEAIPST